MFFGLLDYAGKVISDFAVSETIGIVYAADTVICPRSGLIKEAVLSLGKMVSGNYFFDTD